VVSPGVLFISVFPAYFIDASRAIIAFKVASAFSMQYLSGPN